MRLWGGLGHGVWAAGPALKRRLGLLKILPQAKEGVNRLPLLAGPALCISCGYICLLGLRALSSTQHYDFL